MRPTSTVFDRALPERACTDWVPERNARAPDTDRLPRVVKCCSDPRVGLLSHLGRKMDELISNVF